MKYLLQLVDKTVSSSSQANRIKSILNEVKEGTEDAKSNAEEFYNSLERIVVDLRGWTEHSVAFLNKVRKSEAPNYYEVIKHPMDLGTVLKKVKGQQYKDKKAFVADLELIWSNCLEYNSLPDHPLRRSALLLKARAEQQLQFVMDSPILSKPSLFLGTPDVDSDDGRPTPDEDQTDKTRKGMQSRKRTAAGPGVNSMADKAQASEDAKPTIVADDDEASDGEAEASQMDVDAEESLAADRDRTESPGFETGRTSRASSQAGRASSVLSAKPGQMPFSRRPAIVRSSNGMTKWLALDESVDELDDRPVASTSQLTLDDAPAPSPRALRSASSATLSVPAPSPYKKPLPLPIQQLLNGPTRSPRSPALSRATTEDGADGSEAGAERPLQPLGIWFEDVVNEDLLANALPQLNFAHGRAPRKRRKRDAVKSEHSMAPRIVANVDSLARIRTLHRQVIDLDAPEPLSGPFDIGFVDDPEQPEPAAVVPVDETQLASALRSTSTASTEATAAMTKLCALLCANVGFDASMPGTAETLANAATDYLTNIGRTARFLLDRAVDDNSETTLTLTTLEENGVRDLATLHEHVTESIDARAARLTALETKLDTARRELLDKHADDQPVTSEATILDPESGPALTYVTYWAALTPLSGSHLAPFREDYLAFRRLGLDIQFGISTVPNRLVLGLPPDVSPASAPELAFPPPPPHVALTTEAIDSQIGLLSPFLTARSTTEYGLLDDDSLSFKTKVHRPKVPQSGRIPIKKRAGEGSGSTRSKKRSKVEDAE